MKVFNHSTLSFLKATFLLSLTFIFINSETIAQKKTSGKTLNQGHKINFEIANAPNEEVFIAYHYNGKQYISDTIKLNEKGIGVLEGSERKENGIYLFVFPSLKNQYFDFLISDQYFTVKADKNNLINSLAFENTPDNSLFKKDMTEAADFRKKTDEMHKKAESADENTKKTIEDEIQALNKQFLENRDKLMKDNPNSFYTDLLSLMKEVEIPETPKNEKGEPINEFFGYQYWKTHYWDYIDFSEAGILRTPIYFNKLNDFLDKRTEPVQDSVIKSCHQVIEKSKANREVFQYTLVTILNKYANSKIMGDDAVYVDLVKKYYETGQADWTDSAQLAKMLERANALQPLLLGNISPDLALRDTTLKVKYRLHDLPSEYTVLFVWDPECGHCKKSAPILKEFYDKYKTKDILVYSIATVNYQEIDKWKAFIKEKDLNFINVADPYVETNFRTIYDIASTPQIYVLDKNKKIIAKRLGAEQLEEFFFNYFKRFDIERFKGMENLTFEHSKDDGHDH